MIRVLQISMGEVFGGIEKIELGWMKYINDKKIKIDLLIPNDNTFKEYKNIDEFNIYNLNTTRKTTRGRILYDIRFFRFLHKHKYDIVHINSGAFIYSFRLLLISKICGVKKVIVHSHSTYIYKGIREILYTILNPLYCKLADYYLSVSEDAKVSLFRSKKIRNKVRVLYNGIDTSLFKYSKHLRDKYIKKYNLEGKTIYGHLGRFSIEKNHSFLIDIFYEIYKKDKNSILLLMGDGELRSKIEEKVKKLNIEDNVLFLGFINNVNEVINAVDIGIFPSYYEGFGIAILEMEINGISLYCSNIPDEVNIDNSIKVFSEDDKASNVARMILKDKKIRKNINCSKYDIKNVSKELKKIYINLCKE